MDAIIIPLTTVFILYAITLIDQISRGDNTTFKHRYLENHSSETDENYSFEFNRLQYCENHITTLSSTRSFSKHLPGSPFLKRPDSIKYNLAPNRVSR